MSTYHAHDELSFRTNVEKPGFEGVETDKPVNMMERY